MESWQIDIGNIQHEAVISCRPSVNIAEGTGRYHTQTWNPIRIDFLDSMAVVPGQIKSVRMKLITDGSREEGWNLTDCNFKVCVGKKNSFIVNYAQATKM